MSAERGGVSRRGTCCAGSCARNRAGRVGNVNGLGRHNDRGEKTAGNIDGGSNVIIQKSGEQLSVFMTVALHFETGCSKL